MRRLLSRLQDPLPRLLLAPSKTKYNDATQELSTYLATVTAPAILAALDDALGPLFGWNTTFVDQLFEQYASQTADGHRFWHKSIFVQFAATRLGHHDLLHSSSSVLWHIFSSAAYYPFLATASLDVPSEEEIQLGRLAFRRAFALLVLRGWELFPSDDEKDGSTMYASSERSYSAKLPRLARAFFQCLSVPSPTPPPESGAPGDTVRLANVRNTLVLVHPQRPEPLNIRGATFRPTNLADEFDSSAKRLLTEEDVQSTSTIVQARVVAMDDLQKLMQLLLLIRQGSEVWRAGRPSQTSDIYFARIDLGDAETTQASRYAETLLGEQFGYSAQSLRMEQMTQWSMDTPCVLLSLFQVWTSLFAPAYPDLSRNERPFSTSVINVFCLANSASFVKKPGPASRTLMSEWSLSRSLQHAELVADTATTDLRGSELRQILTVNPQDFFVLLFQGQDVGVAGSPDPRIERSFAAFVNSVPDEPLRIKEDGEGRLASYTWRSSVMQLQPSIVRGVGMGSGARVDGELLQLFSHNSAGGSSTSVVIDLEKKTVVVDGLDLSAQPRMSLESLRYYRIPRNPAS